MKARKRRGALLGLVLITIAALTVGPAVAGHPTSSLTGSDFEIDDDANLVVDHTGNADWASVAEDRQADTLSGKDDNSYSGGAKEDDLCPSTSTGSIPPNKSDLLNFGVHEEAGTPGFLHLFWHRVQEPSGTTLMDFELNQSSTPCGNGANVARTVDDLLIEYRIEQGGARADILIREWTGSQWGPEQNLTAVGVATGTINDSPIPAAGADGLGTISPRTFGEATIDLDFIFDSSVCRSFGSAFLKSRSSTSFTSAMKDFIAPRSINISNCGKIDILKTDDTGAVLSGATFTLYEDNAPTAASGQLAPGAEDVAVSPERSCTSALDGTCSITNVLAGSYWVVETTTPANHDTAAPQPAVVGADDTVELTFVNVRQRGSILVKKVDAGGAVLDGAGFTLVAGPDTPIVVPGVAGQTGMFCVDNLTFGTYTVRETTAPPGYQAAADQTVTVAVPSDCATRTAGPDATFTNNAAPGTINVQKNDDDGSPLTGAAFTVFEDVGTVGTYEPGVDTTVAAGPTTVGLDGSVSFTNLPAESDYCVVETTTPPGYETADPQCVTLGIGSSSSGATLNLTFENVQEHKVIVIVCHEGTGMFAPASTGSSSALLTAAELGAGDPTEAQLCALAGDAPRAHADTVTVTIGGHLP